MLGRNIDKNFLKAMSPEMSESMIRSARRMMVELKLTPQGLLEMMLDSLMEDFKKNNPPDSDKSWAAVRYTMIRTTLMHSMRNVSEEIFLDKLEEILPKELDRLIDGVKSYQSSIDEFREKFSEQPKTQI